MVGTLKEPGTPNRRKISTLLAFWEHQGHTTSTTVATATHRQGPLVAAVGEPKPGQFADNVVDLHVQACGDGVGLIIKTGTPRAGEGSMPGTPQKGKSGTPKKAPGTPTRVTAFTKGLLRTVTRKGSPTKTKSNSPTQQPAATDNLAADVNTHQHSHNVQEVDSGATDGKSPLHALSDRLDLEGSTAVGQHDLTPAGFQAGPQGSQDRQRTMSSRKLNLPPVSEAEELAGGEGVDGHPDSPCSTTYIHHSRGSTRVMSNVLGSLSGSVVEESMFGEEGVGTVGSLVRGLHTGDRQGSGMETVVEDDSEDSPGGPNTDTGPGSNDRTSFADSVNTNGLDVHGEVDGCWLTGEHHDQNGHRDLPGLEGPHTRESSAEPSSGPSIHTVCTTPRSAVQPNAAYSVLSPSSRGNDTSSPGSVVKSPALSTPGRSGDNSIQNAATTVVYRDALATLVTSGLVTEGDTVCFMCQGKATSTAVIRGTKLLCRRCNRLETPVEFAGCAGVPLRRPLNHIIHMPTGNSLRDILDSEARRLLLLARGMDPFVPSLTPRRGHDNDSGVTTPDGQTEWLSEQLVVLTHRLQGQVQAYSARSQPQSACSNSNTSNTSGGTSPRAAPARARALEPLPVVNTTTAGGPSGTLSADASTLRDLLSVGSPVSNKSSLSRESSQVSSDVALAKLLISHSPQSSPLDPSRKREGQTDSVDMGTEASADTPVDASVGTPSATVQDAALLTTIPTEKGTCSTADVSIASVRLSTPHADSQAAIVAPKKPSGEAAAAIRSHGPSNGAPLPPLNASSGSFKKRVSSTTSRNSHEALLTDTANVPQFFSLGVRGAVSRRKDDWDISRGTSDSESIRGFLDDAPAGEVTPLETPQGSPQTRMLAQTRSNTSELTMAELQARSMQSSLATTPRHGSENAPNSLQPMPNLYMPDASENTVQISTPLPSSLYSTGIFQTALGSFSEQAGQFGTPLSGTTGDGVPNHGSVHAAPAADNASVHARTPSGTCAKPTLQVAAASMQAASMQAASAVGHDAGDTQTERTESSPRRNRTQYPPYDSHLQLLPQGLPTAYGDAEQGLETAPPGAMATRYLSFDNTMGGAEEVSTLDSQPQPVMVDGLVDGGLEGGGCC